MVESRWSRVRGTGPLFFVEGVEGAGDALAALFEDVEVLLGRA